MKDLLELIMIVKNSGEILRQCLLENKKYIDRWTILDTGSTDNTCEIIESCLCDIPGQLHHSGFVDFSTARNEVLSLSLNMCKYQIILDDSYIIRGGKMLRKLLKKSKKDCLMMFIGKYVENYLRDSYLSKRIIRSSSVLRYKYRVHEEIQVIESKLGILDCSMVNNSPSVFIDDLTFETHTKRSFSRYDNDIELLHQDLVDNPTDERVMYYLAKTYQVMDNHKMALEFFKKLRRKAEVRADFLFASNYEISNIEYYDNIKNNVSSATEKYRVDMEELKLGFSGRVEPYYKLAVIAKDENRLDDASELLLEGLKIPKPTGCGTLVELDIYEYLIYYLCIEVHLMLKKFDVAIPLLKYLLNMYPNDVPLLNMKYALNDIKVLSEPILLSENKTVVINTGCWEFIYCWNPLGDKRISGSELMAISLSEELMRLGYRVIIFGTFEDVKNNINYEGVYNGVEYIDYKYFDEFASKYVIDYYIVSRFCCNLTYQDNIKNVYLWIHDTLPLIDDDVRFVQFHSSKFKGIIAVSEWQKNNTIRCMNIPRQAITVLRNSITPSDFTSNNIDKVSHRFIYSSCVSRGLIYLLRSIDKIVDRYADATFYLYINQSKLDVESLDLIGRHSSRVFVSDRIPRKELAIEYLKSDIWFYPCNFKETYCISAVEAMMARCLVVSSSYGALEEIIGNRGVLCDAPIKDNVDKLIDKMFFVNDRPALKDMYLNRAQEWARTKDTESLARDFVSIFERANLSP